MFSLIRIFFSLRMFSDASSITNFTCIFLQTSKKATPSLQTLEFLRPLPEHEDEATSMMIEKSNSLRGQSPTRIIEDVLGSPELEGYELAIVSWEIAKEAGRSASFPEEVLEDKGFRGSQGR